MQVRNSMDEEEDLGEARFMAAAEQSTADSDVDAGALPQPPTAEQHYSMQQGDMSDSAAASAGSSGPEGGSESSGEYGDGQHRHSVWQRLKGMLPGGGKGKTGAAAEGKAAGHHAASHAEPDQAPAGGRLSAGRILERSGSAKTGDGGDNFAAQLFGPTPGAVAASQAAGSANKDDTAAEGRNGASGRELTQVERDAQYAAALRGQRANAGDARSHLEQVLLSSELHPVVPCPGVQKDIAGSCACLHDRAASHCVRCGPIAA